MLEFISIAQTWTHFSWEQPVIPYRFRTLLTPVFQLIFSNGLSSCGRRARCAQPVIAFPLGSDYRAYAMPYGFKGTENLRRTRSVCLSGNTCNMAFVVWGEKQFRRNTRRINGIWYVILSQKNPCRLAGGHWWLLEGVMEVHFSLWRKDWWSTPGAVCASWEPFDFSEPSEILQALTIWSISDQTHLLNIISFETVQS